MSEQSDNLFKLFFSESTQLLLITSVMIVLWGIERKVCSLLGLITTEVKKGQEIVISILGDIIFEI